MALGKYSRHALRYTPAIRATLWGTLGIDAGLSSDGVWLGTITPGAITKAFALDYGAGPGTFTDNTTAANEATANDMTLFPASPAVNDAYYFGSTALFCGMNLTIGTGAGSPVMTTLWEYYNGSAWATLTATADETTILQQTGTGAKKVRWVPPATWGKVTVNSASEYWVRCRISAFTSISTVPLGSRVYTIPLTSAVGYLAPYSGTVDKVNWNAGTVSGSTADSVFLLLNLTQGTQDYFTLTKALRVGQDATLALGVSAGDLLAVQQIAEDGSTEFANVGLEFFIQP